MGESAPTVIGLDVGTSTVEAVVFTVDGAPGPATSRDVATVASADGTVTQDPDDLHRVVLDVLADAVARTDRRVDAIAVTTAMHALVGLDDDDRAVTPLVTWADTRATDIVADWRRDGTAGFVHQRTGVPLHPMAPVAKLAWFTAHRDTPPVARWADLKALVSSWLTGAAVTEISTASGWGLMDLRTGTWDPDALRLAGVTPDDLPPIVPTTAARPLVRSAADRTGLDVGTPVVAGAADGPCANLGVGATEPGVAGLSLGTSGAVRVVVDHVPEPVPDGLFCYALDAKRRVLGGALSNGGNIVDWLADVFTDPVASSADDRHRDRFSAVDALAAAAPPGSDGLVMVPYLVAERAPLWDPTVPAAYLGLRRRHRRPHLVRAAFEGVAAGLGAITDRIAAVQPVTAVRATGGAFASPLWRTLVAAAVARPVTIPDVVGGSATGAAALGLVALGVTDDPVAARAMLTAETTAEAGAEPVPVPSGLRDAAVATRRSLGSLAARDDRVADAFGTAR